MRTREANEGEWEMMSMQKYFKVGVVAGLLALLVGCGGASKDSTASGFTCSVAGTLASGTAAASTAVSVSGIVVNIVGGAGGPYAITIPGAASVSSTTTSYSYPGTVSLTSNAYGGVSSTVTVTDNSNSASTTCYLSLGGTTGGTTGPITITPAPSTSTSVNGTITLSAYSATYPGATYTFTNSTGGSAMVTALSGSTASVTNYSGVAATVTITVTSPTYAGLTSTIVLYFGTGTTTGGLCPGIVGSGVYNSSSPTCTLYSLSGTAAYRGSAMAFSISSNTGEPLEILQASTGEPSSTATTYPICPAAGTTSGMSFQTSFQYSGLHTMTIVAGSAVRPGVTCNNGAPMYVQFTIY